MSDFPDPILVAHDLTSRVRAAVLTLRETIEMSRQVVAESKALIARLKRDDGSHRPSELSDENDVSANVARPRPGTT